MSPKSLANSPRQAGEPDWDNFPEFDPLSRTDSVAADLPPAGVNRWVVRRKAAVVAAVRSGAIGLEEAVAVMSCQRKNSMPGRGGLRATV